MIYTYIHTYVIIYPKLEYIYIYIIYIIHIIYIIYIIYYIQYKWICIYIYIYIIYTINKYLSICTYIYIYTYIYIRAVPPPVVARRKGIMARWFAEKCFSPAPPSPVWPGVRVQWLCDLLSPYLFFPLLHMMTVRRLDA